MGEPKPATPPCSRLLRQGLLRGAPDPFRKETQGDGDGPVDREHPAVRCMDIVFVGGL